MDNEVLFTEMLLILGEPVDRKAEIGYTTWHREAHDWVESRTGWGDWSGGMGDCRICIRISEFIVWLAEQEVT